MEIFHGKLKTKLNMYAKQHENIIWTNKVNKVSILILMSFSKRNSYNQLWINPYGVFMCRVFMLWVRVKVRADQVKQLDRKNYLIKEVNSQFSSKLVISIPSFPNTVRNSRITKPHFSPSLVYGLLCKSNDWFLFEMQIKWLVSIWNATRGWIELTLPVLCI